MMHGHMNVKINQIDLEVVHPRCAWNIIGITIDRTQLVYVVIIYLSEWLHVSAPN